MKSLKGKLTLVTCIICIVCLVITAAISYHIASYLQVTAGTLEAQKMTDFDQVASYMKELIENHNEEEVIYDIYFTYADNRMNPLTKMRIPADM